MKQPLLFILLFFLLLFGGCSTKKSSLQLEKFPHTLLEPTEFSALNGFEDEDFNDLLTEFLHNCQSKKSVAIFGDLCENAKSVTDAKSFFTQNFTPYRIKSTKEGRLTGYFEASLNASKTKSKRYCHPVYGKPKDLLRIDLSQLYPQLEGMRLRGRLVGSRVVPYYSRKEAKERGIDANVLCYCDSKIDRFFLEIQGSGIAKFEDGSVMYLGYSDQNGHPYRAIGRYLVGIGALTREEVSMQSIRKWLQEHPQRLDEVLNYNASQVFFQEKKQPATGSLGVVLHPYRSVAVDKKYIPLGSMLYFRTDSDKKKMHGFVFAQDTGGAIKGAVRADLFVGNRAKDVAVAGELNEKLFLWMILPKGSL